MTAPENIRKLVEMFEKNLMSIASIKKPQEKESLSVYKRMMSYAR